MNDGGGLPAEESGTRRFSEALAALRAKAMKSGAKRVVFCTPPIHDNKGDPKLDGHEQNLERYTAWLLSKREAGWDVVDIQGGKDTG